jgi:hypothetical protein
MKKLGLILIIAPLVFNFIGCDSATDSKATSVGQAPTLLQPSNNATGVSRYPVFKWSGEADKLEISTNPNFNPPDRSANVSGTQYQLPDPPLAPTQVYFWRAGKTSGSTVIWSNSWKFTTGAN